MAMQQTKAKGTIDQLSRVSSRRKLLSIGILLTLLVRENLLSCFRKLIRKRSKINKEIWENKRISAPQGAYPPAILDYKKARSPSDENCESYGGRAGGTGSVSNWTLLL